MQFPDVTPRAFLRITQVTVVIVVINIVTGAAVRLSDSGLGCPDWPTCSKHSLTPALSLHPAIEFGNRMVVVVLCIATALAVLAALRRAPRRRDLVWLSAGLLGGVLGEAVLGAVVVYTKLNPYVVMTHFMVGIALLTDAFVLALRAGRADGGGTAVSKVARRERRISQAMVGLLVVAIAAGTATTGSGPHAGGKGAKRLPIALEEMARIHSGIVICLVVLTLALLYLLDRTGAPSTVLERARVLLGAMVLQGGIGYVQYFTHLPALLVGVHVFGATVVWMAMLWFYDGLTHHAAPLRPGDEVSGSAGTDGIGRLGGTGDGATTAVPSGATARYPGLPMTGPGTEVQPVEVDKPEGGEDVRPDLPWLVIVWNDPINLMSYVTYVFQKLFGFSRDKATKLMLDVHHKGRAVVSSGPRERAELDVFRLHEYGLWATMERSS